MLDRLTHHPLHDGTQYESQATVHYSDSAASLNIAVCKDLREAVHTQVTDDMPHDTILSHVNTPL